MARFKKVINRISVQPATGRSGGENKNQISNQEMPSISYRNVVDIRLQKQNEARKGSGRQEETRRMRTRDRVIIRTAVEEGFKGENDKEKRTGARSIRR